MTLEEVKTFLGITDTAQDTQLTSILAFVESWASSVVGDLNDGEKTIQVKLESTVGEFGESILPLDHKGCTSIKEINGQLVSSLQDGVDYQIRDDGIVEFPTLDTYLRNLKFSTFKVKYEISGVINEKYKGAIASICGYLLGLDMGREVQSEQMGPRKIQYASMLPMGGDTTQVPKQIEMYIGTILSFIPLHLKVW